MLPSVRIPLASLVVCFGCAGEDSVPDDPAEIEGPTQSASAGVQTSAGATRFARVLHGTDDAQAVAVAGRNGEAVLGGWFVGELELDATTLSSAGEADIYLVAYAPDGELTWSRRFGDAARQELADVATGANDRLCVTGNFLGSVEFGSGTAVLAEPTVGLFGNAYVAVLDRHGRGIWAEEMTLSEGGAAVVPAAAGMDSSGAAYVTGAFEGTFTVGETTITSGVVRSFLLRFRRDGSLEWFRIFGGADDAVFGLGTDNDGNVVIATESTSSSQIDVRAWTTAGDLLASASFPAVIAGAGVAQDVAVDGDGSVYLVGQGAFGVAPDHRSYLAKLNADLGLAGVRVLEDMVVREIAVTPSAKLAIAGERISGSPVEQVEFAAQLPFTGAFDWVRLFAGDGFTNDLSVTGKGDVYLAGELGGPFDLGSGALVPVDASDLFIAALSR